MSKLRSSRRSLLLVAAAVCLSAALGVVGCGNTARHEPSGGPGLEIVLQAAPTGGERVTLEDLDAAVAVLRDRLAALGVTKPDIRKQPPDRIVVRLQGVRASPTGPPIVLQTGLLELYDLEGDLRAPSIDTQGNPVPHTSLFKLLASVQKQAGKGTPSGYTLFTKTHRLVLGPVARRPKVASGELVLAVPQGLVILTCGGATQRSLICPGGSDPAVVNFYLFAHTPELTGKDVNASGVKQAFDMAGNPIVRLPLTSKGEHAFQSLTRKLYQRGQLRRTPQHFAIVLDGVITSFPLIDYADSTLSDGITGGGEITGVTLQEAQSLALVLRYGPLPVPFRQVAQRTFG
jgi:preprotein translocase subunit SecD